MACENKFLMCRRTKGRPRRPRNAWKTNQESPIYDCYEVLEKCAWIWRIFGIFPLTIKYRMGMKKYEISKFFAVYSFLICCTCIVYCIHGLTLGMNSWIGNKSQASAMDDEPLGKVRTRHVLSLLCMIVASIGRVIRHKELSEIVHMLAKQDLMLERMNCCLRYESNARIFSTYVWISSINLMMFMVYDFYALGLVCGRIMVKWLISITPMIAQILDLTIFVILVASLGSRFRAINEKINTVIKRTNSSRPKVIMTADTCADNLRNVAKLHYNICALGKRVNCFFAWDVVIHVIVTFMLLFETLYYIFILVDKVDTIDYLRIGTCVHWEFIHGAPLIIVVAICNWTTYEGVRTGKLIHEIDVEKIDSGLYEAVKTFSLQLHHQKLDFTAAGFFPINSRLIQTMVAELTTYLVILIQFQTTLDTMSGF